MVDREQARRIAERAEVSLPTVRDAYSGKPRVQVRKFLAIRDAARALELPEPLLPEYEPDSAA